MQTFLHMSFLSVCPHLGFCIGLLGPPGEQGPPGNEILFKGDPGPDGLHGLPGCKGDRGFPGPPGSQNYAGFVGTKGTLQCKTAAITCHTFECTLNVAAC